MTRLEPSSDSGFERIVELLLLVVFWSSFTALGAGLIMWLAFPSSDAGMVALVSGLFGLLLMPIIRVLWAMAAAFRDRDWLLLGATLVVLAILVAFTLRDAAAL